MELYRTENLTYIYPDLVRPALDEVSMNVDDGEFLLLLGDSGCGKSTLLRALAGLMPDFYGGKIGGRVLFRGRDIDRMDRRQLLRNVGMVFQDPEKQLVKTRVEQEIAFGLENLGLSPVDMRKRVAEILNFFDLSGLKDTSVSDLSGGQKQKVVLASVMAMQPKVLLLDEPTSQLDPVAAEEVFNTLKRLNEELGLTIVLVEQRLDRCFHIADRVIVMDRGQIKNEGTPQEAAAWAIRNKRYILPPVTEFFCCAGSDRPPLTVREGRKRLSGMGFRPREDNEPSKTAKPVLKKLWERLGKKISNRETVGGSLVKLHDLWFRYEERDEVLKGVSLEIGAGEFTVILGENGAGKSTLIKTMNGLLQPDRGAVLVDGRSTASLRIDQIAATIGYLGQNPNDYLFHDTVDEELKFTMDNLGIADEGQIEQVLDRLGILEYRYENPRDLSGGQRQRVALASVLVAGPKVLLLDEPTRGLDANLKQRLGNFLQGLAAEGTSVVMITHDIEFAARYTQRVILLFDGRVVADGDKYEVLSGGVFYSPQIQKLFRGFETGVLTVDDALSRWEGLSVEVS
ncbi:ABC transporter ATP-binding protein [Phosphitispora fastidiosa]|uniref:ABC transporter ATP-binding protein n=1 Tax=Phosphitispora fastidiosa TaxID=2837202 RepID=UPI001E361574|nr:ATP-binding cassette domain-containing protein [Phosphitispora fastidiosa]MBU7005854.1 energy-coupling factor transport system ATP-binding protein [Phosphitispora fastidiosa]